MKPKFFLPDTFGLFLAKSMAAATTGIGFLTAAAVRPSARSLNSIQAIGLPPPCFVLLLIMCMVTPCMICAICIVNNDWYL